MRFPFKLFSVYMGGLVVNLCLFLWAADMPSTMQRGAIVAVAASLMYGIGLWGRRILDEVKK